MKSVGVILMATGIFALIYTGYTFNTLENGIAIEPVDLTKDKRLSSNWLPITGFILIIVGASALKQIKKLTFLVK